MFFISEFDELIRHNFFIIDSENLNSIQSHLYGFAIDNESIIQNDGWDKKSTFLGNGVYVQIIKTSGDISIYQDFNGSFGLYLFRYNDYFAISNSFLKLVDHVKENFVLSLNEDYAKHFMAIGLCSLSYMETLIREICVLPKNAFFKIDISSKRLSIEFSNYEEHSICISSMEGIQLLDNWYYKWVNIFRSLKMKTNNISLQLSGGFDSRLVLAMVLSANIDLDKILIYSIDDNKHTHGEDFKIASQIADYFGFQLNNNVISSERIFFKEIETPVNISFFTKLGIHKQMFYTSSYKSDPVYSITGYGGENIRNYWDTSLNRFIEKQSRTSSDYSPNFVEPMKNIILRSFSQIEENVDYETSLHELYCQTRSRNHFGKLSAEFFCSNLIKLSPLLDPDLYKLKLNDDECADKNLLIALIFSRYCPDLLKFRFQGNRHISDKTVNYAQKINEKYPLNNTDLNFISGPDADIRPEKTEDFFDKSDCENFIRKIFFSKSFKKSFKSHFSGELYYKLVQKINSLNYFPLESVYAAISVIKACDDVNYSSYKHSSVLNAYFNKSFMNYEENRISDEFKPLLDKYNTARIDLKNMGSKSNRVEIINVSDSLAKITSPNWFVDEYGSGLVLLSEKNSMDIKFRCIGNGELVIHLRGVDVRDAHNKRIPIYIAYTKFVVNDELIFNSDKVVWHDNNYKKSFSVNDGDIITLHVEWKPLGN